MRETEREGGERIQGQFLVLKRKRVQKVKLELTSVAWV